MLNGLKGTCTGRCPQSRLVEFGFLIWTKYQHSQQLEMLLTDSVKVLHNLYWLIASQFVSDIFSLPSES